MKQEFKDQNRILWDDDARHRLSKKYLKHLTGYIVLIVVVTIVSHFDVISKNEDGFEMSQLLCIAIIFMALPPSLYMLAQLKRMINIEKKENE